MKARYKLAAAIVLALTPIAAAQGAVNATPVVEGHTVFVQLSPAGSDLAAIAGSVQCQVLWFNDQVLFRVDAGEGGLCGEQRFVYAYAANAPDPRGNPTLKPTGMSWDFTDPNGAPWHVVEYQYHQLQILVNQNLGLLPNFVGENVTIEQLNYTAWIVEAGPAVRDPTLNADYNFVVLVDTAKTLLTEDDTVVHDGTPGDVAGGNSHDRTRPGETHRTPHTHDKSWVSLALGDAPAIWE